MFLGPAGQWGPVGEGGRGQAGRGGGDGPVLVALPCGGGGGGGGRRPAPDSLGPKWGAAHGLHACFVVA